MAEAVALSAFRFEAPRNRLVCTAEDFPSMLYLYEGLDAARRRGRARAGARGPPHRRSRHRGRDRRAHRCRRDLAHVVPQRPGAGSRADRRQAHTQSGALVLIDAYQSIGTVPLDVQASNIDMLAGGSVKWLCGGPGAGYLYVSPRVAPKLEPAITGWMTHERPFDFEPGRSRATPVRGGSGSAHRGSRHSSRPARAMTIVAGIGVAAIRAKSLRQTDRMIAWADEFRMTLGSPREPERRGGTVVLDVPNAESACLALLGRGRAARLPPGCGAEVRAPLLHSGRGSGPGHDPPVRDAVAASRANRGRNLHGNHGNAGRPNRSRSCATRVCIWSAARSSIRRAIERLPRTTTA